MGEPTGHLPPGYLPPGAIAPLREGASDHEFVQYLYDNLCRVPDNVPDNALARILFMGVVGFLIKKGRILNSGMASDDVMKRNVDEVARRLIDIGWLNRAVVVVPRKSVGAAPVTGAAPKVFISHSHHDRETASLLQTILEENKILTFLDQHKIIAGQDLKGRIIEGIEWCDQLLLLWSAHAHRSNFVNWEWQHAKSLSKRILPYILDDTPLPDALDRICGIDCSDQQHGHAELLRAILGRQWKPDTATLFPGLWHAEINVVAGEGWYELELRANGQIIGRGGIKNTGFMASLAQSSGLTNALTAEIPLTGTWSYDEREGVLTMETFAHFMGQVQKDVVKIRTSGKAEGWLEGHTLGGFRWRMKRVR